jgi:hypothetical protein
MKRLVFLMVGAALLGTSALADGIRPVTLQVKEQESGKFLAKWRVPKQHPCSPTRAALRASGP